MTAEEKLTRAIAAPVLRGYARGWQDERMSEGMSHDEAVAAFNHCASEHLEPMNAIFVEARVRARYILMHAFAPTGRVQ